MLLMWRVPKLTLNKRLGFPVFLGLIVAFGAGLGLYTRNQRQNAPQRSLEALHASLNEVVLAVSSLKAIDGSSDTSPYAITNTQTSLKNSLETAQKLLGGHKDTLGTQYQPLADALKQQKESLDELQAASEILGKAISYSPSLDLGSLDANQHKDKLYDRAFAANDNLFKLAETYEDRFSEEANQTLNTSVNCFGELADLLEANKINQVEPVRDRCINTYQATRKELVAALLETYKTKKSENSLRVIVDYTRSIQ